MRILVMSDIHANLSALEAVLNDAGLVDAVWCLGDLVGYGPNPNECVQRIQELPNLVCVQGNHDAAALGKIDTEAFNNEAGQALRWTKTTLSTSSLAFLDSLPEKQVVDLVTLTHGSPRRPIWSIFWILIPRRSICWRWKRRMGLWAIHTIRWCSW